MKKTTPRLRPGQRVLIALLAVFTALPFIGFSTADANPLGPNVKVSTSDTSVTVTVNNGTVSIEQGKLVFKNIAGITTEKFPLSYIAPDNRTYPIDASVKGRTATLTPSKQYARSTSTSASALKATDVADKNGYKSQRERDDAALARFNSEMAAAVTISTIIGTAIGAVLGGLLAGVICAATALPAVIACIPVGAAIGGIAGTVLGGGGALIDSAIRYFDTINKPFVHVKPRN